MITHLLAVLVGFVAGFLVHRRHASKAATLEQKGKDLLAALKGK
jgi:F0F1-type ATP synthase assembly protein I